MTNTFGTKAAFFQALCMSILVSEFGYDVEEITALAHAPAVELRDECGEEGFGLWHDARVKAAIV